MIFGKSVKIDFGVRIRIPYEKLHLGNMVRSNFHRLFDLEVFCHFLTFGWYFEVREHDSQTRLEKTRPGSYFVDLLDERAPPVWTPRARGSLLPPFGPWGEALVKVCALHLGGEDLLMLISLVGNDVAVLIQGLLQNWLFNFASNYNYDTHPSSAYPSPFMAVIVPIPSTVDMVVIRAPGFHVCSTIPETGTA